MKIFKKTNHKNQEIDFINLKKMGIACGKILNCILCSSYRKQISDRSYKYDC